MKTITLVLVGILVGSPALAEDACDGDECNLRDKPVHRWLNPHTGELEVYRGDKRALYNPRTGEWSLVDTGKRTYIPVPNNDDSSENPK